MVAKLWSRDDITVRMVALPPCKCATVYVYTPRQECRLRPSVLVSPQNRAAVHYTNG